MTWLPDGVGTAELPKRALKYLRPRAPAEAIRRAGGVYLTAAETLAIKLRPDNMPQSDSLAFPDAKNRSGVVRFLAPGALPKFKMTYKARLRLFYPPFRPRSDYDRRAVRRNVREPIRLVEGPIKAACLNWHDLPAVGLNGVWGGSQDHKPIRDFDRWAWEGRTVIADFDSDVIRKVGPRQALWWLWDSVLRPRGAAQLLITLIPEPQKVKVGPDDLVMAEGRAALLALEADAKPITDARFFDWGAPAYVQELNQELAVVLDGHGTIAIENRGAQFPAKVITLSRRRDAEVHFANRIVTYTVGVKQVRSPAFPLWLEAPQRREFRALVLKPDQPPGYDPVTKDFNLWEGWGVEEHKPDGGHSWSCLKAHIEQIVAAGNQTHAEYVLNLMAFWVQNPGVRPLVALVLRGNEGIGKGILLNAVVKLFGKHGLAIGQQHHLTGKHNTLLEGVLFIVGDEAFFAGDKASNAVLKRLITEPFLQIEPKFVNPYTLPNLLKLAISSNEHWVIPAGLDARRFAVFNVSNARKEDHPYFAAMTAQLDSGGLEAMLYDLRRRDLSSFDPRKFPKTKALFEQKKLSFDAPTGWWFDKLCLGRLTEFDRGWTGRIRCSVAQDEIRKRLGSSYENRSIETLTGIRLKELCPGVERVRPQLDRRRVWYYEFPGLKVCRADFERHLQTRINWKTGNSKGRLR